MPNKPDTEKLAKLPVWAQEYIRDLERQREVAVRALNTYCDNQTPSPFSINELAGLGEQQWPSSKVRYIQTHKIHLAWQGVELDVYCSERGIELQWGLIGYSIGEVACIPAAFQKVRLVAKDQMRS